MLYLAFAFNALVLVALVFELHQARKERQALALLIKSRDVAEFVRAERHLAAPASIDEVKGPDIVDLDEANPEDVLNSLTDTPKP